MQAINCIAHVLIPEDNEGLTMIPEEEESRREVFAIDPNSAPGPDGFGGQFYQSCWDIIK